MVYTDRDAYSLELLGDRLQTPYRGSAPGPRWGTRPIDPLLRPPNVWHKSPPLLSTQYRIVNALLEILLNIT